jgi:hypothetical protein
MDTYTTRELSRSPRFLFNRIITARMKRMTTQDAPRAHPTAAHSAITLDGFTRIL